MLLRVSNNRIENTPAAIFRTGSLCGLCIIDCTVPAIPVSDLVEEASAPWEEVELMEGTKGPIRTLVTCCRVVELQDVRDGKEL